ncbi:hypothetical protein BX666DRAFT_1868004 [Dichotomocladium elegans]|nr:hypothetical protein BX666DRAFT_1868004 [Dichotomocladium elegans]
MSSTTICCKAEVHRPAHVCSGRGNNYCLIHRRYFETSWCPDCQRMSGSYAQHDQSYMELIIYTRIASSH